MNDEMRGTGRRGRGWTVMALAGAASVGAVAALGDRGFLAAAALLAVGTWLARRLTAGKAKRDPTAGQMTTDPWQGEVVVDAPAAPAAKRRRGTRSIQRLG